MNLKWLELGIMDIFLQLCSNPLNEIVINQLNRNRMKQNPLTQSRRRTIYYLIYLTMIQLCLIHPLAAQKVEKLDLNQLLKEGRLIKNGKILKPLEGKKKSGVTCDNIVWIKGFSFSEGTIEVDLRGKDEFQKSFLGIAFHGVDSVTYDAIYFRPFNFNSEDTARRKRAVQYVSEPEYPWYVLREKRTGVFEKGIIPPPSASDWFHAKIEVEGDDINVYVDHSSTPSLKVKKLNNRTNGLFGLWNGALQGDFANLVVTHKQ